ncbi:MAG TPA: hypothetical protein DIW31_10815 [Bacteroidales bacterium]|nr:hypothetical protein [Bacteroidales bacterium]
MKIRFSFLIALIIFLYSCQKDEITSIKDKDESITEKSSNAVNPTGSTVYIFVGSAPTPSTNGEVQLALSSSYSYPIYVHFNIKQTVSSPTLISGYYTIPAGQRYLVCDIDDYGYSTLYLQICNVYDNSGYNNYMVNYTVAKVTYSLNSVAVTFPIVGSYVALSNLSCGGAFYKPSSGGTVVPIPDPGHFE